MNFFFVKIKIHILNNISTRREYHIRDHTFFPLSIYIPLLLHLDLVWSVEVKHSGYISYPNQTIWVPRNVLRPSDCQIIFSLWILIQSMEFLREKKIYKLHKYNYIIIVE